MGLDNGIILRTNTKLDVHDGDEDCYSVPEYVHLERAEGYSSDIGKFKYSCEVCYFRKSWAFRDMVFTVLEGHDKPAHDCGITELTAVDVELIRDGLLDFFKNPEEWDDGAQVFYMEASVAHIAQEALNLGWLIDWMYEHPNDVVYFYDSY